MEVPLSVSTIVVKGKEKLSIWYNGKKHIIDAPIAPYFYTKYKREDISRVPKTVSAVALSNYQKKQFYKYSFDTRARLVAVRDTIGSQYAFESNIPFIIRNRLDNPDIFKKFPHTNKLKFLFLDIEQYSAPDKMFPTYEDRLLSIAWCGNDRDIQCAYIKKGNPSDKGLLEFFAKKYNEIDPDVIVVYNKNYDIPTIIRRCERNGINPGWLAKDGSRPYIGGRNNINIEGVVIYDVYDSAKGDQSLTGDVANRGLKEVSDFFGFDSGRAPLDTKSMHEFVGTPELVEYNKDDVERLLVCFDIYWPNIEFNANDLKLPLSEVTDLNITNLGLVVIGDEHKRLNIIADGLNKHRYPEVFLRKKKASEANYEGALIAIYRTGLFEPVYKADYSCVDEKTEALTNHGWKKYWEIDNTDKLVTWNVLQDTFELETPSKINIHNYDGDLIHSNTRHISMAVTPNHRVYHYKLRGKDKGGLFVDRADELQTYINVPINSFYGGKTPEEYKKYIPLMAWIITEGSISRVGKHVRIIISQRTCVSLDNSIDYVRKILEKSGLSFTERKRKNRPDVEFSLNVKEAKMILSMMGNDGKHIPDFIFWSDKETREMFISELVYGDGTDYRVSGATNTRVYGSKDKQLTDELQMLCTLTGYRTTVNHCYVCGREMYYTHIFRRNVTGLRLNQLRPTKDVLYIKKNYKGKVWCPTTKNKTWVCRRDNKIHITGNSLYPSIMASFNLSPDTTTLLKYKSYSGKFEMIEEDQWYVYNIPDKVINKDMVIQVLKTPGFSSQLVERFLRERSEYKTLLKQTGLKKYRAMSDNRKVKANGGVYGTQGSANHAYGFLPTAIATCGVGRECAFLLKDILGGLYPKSVIEIDSVTGDTPVFIRDKKTKEIDIVPIEDLSDGSLRKITTNIEALTRNGWKNLNYVYSHKVNKNIYTIKTFGARIDVTEDHSLFSDRKEIKPSVLKIGDVIDIYPSTDFGNTTNFNKNQAWLLGFFLSDGTIHKRPPRKKVFLNKDGSKRKLRKVDHYDLFIAKKDLQLLEKAKNILLSDFNLDCKIYNTLKSSGCYKLEGWKKEPIKYIRKMCYCEDKRTKKVPKEILNAPMDVVDSFFDGLTDGDGHICTDKKNEGKWAIDSIFKPLAAGIAYLLDRRHITYNVMTRSDKPNITTVITHKPKEYCTRSVKKGNPGTVSKISYEHKEEIVYDLGTDDGTFVGGVGRVILHNTDGAYYTAQNHDEDTVKELFEEKLYEKFKKDDLRLSIDVDSYKKGYFYKAKNYVLETLKGKLIFHGAAMKASSKNLMNKELIRELAVAALDKQPIDDIREKYMRLDFPLKHFAMSKTMGMRMSDYKTPESTLVVQLAKAAEKHFNIKPELENQYYYIKALDGYKLMDLAKLKDVDTQYYREQVQTVTDMFVKKTIKPKLSKWL